LKDSLAVMQRQLIQEERRRDRFKEQDIISGTCESVLASSYQISERIIQDMKDYSTFFIKLRQACVSNLYLDATYDRRRSSLQILLLMQDLLCNEYKSVEWTKEQAETIYQCLELDTYEFNKEMAFRILKSMNPKLLHMYFGVELMTTTAFKLSESMRPIDSVTAAYLLKLSKYLLIAMDVLHLYCQVEDNVEEAITLQLISILHRKLQVYICKIGCHI